MNQLAAAGLGRHGTWSHLAAHHAHVTGAEGTAVVVLALVAAVLWARRARHTPATVTGGGGLVGLAALIVAAIAAWNMHPALRTPAAARPTPSPVITHFVTHTAAPSLPGWGVIAALIIAILATAAAAISITAIKTTMRGRGGNGSSD